MTLNSGRIDSDHPYTVLNVATKRSKLKPGRRHFVDVRKGGSGRCPIAVKGGGIDTNSPHHRRIFSARCSQPKNNFNSRSFVDMFEKMNVSFTKMVSFPSRANDGAAEASEVAA